MNESTASIAVLETELRALRDKLDLIRETDRRALEMQAKEYERRLEDLNHSRALAEKRYGEYIPRDTHAADLRLRDAKIDGNARVIHIAVGILLAVQLLVPVIFLLLLKR